MNFQNSGKRHEKCSSLGNARCDYVHLNAAFVWLLICSFDVTFNNKRDIEKKTGFSLNR